MLMMIISKSLAKINMLGTRELNAIRIDRIKTVLLLDTY
jgi:hypothetical protein